MMHPTDTVAAAPANRRKKLCMKRRPSRAVGGPGVQGGPANISDAFVPPNPKEFESAYLTLRCLARLGTKSISQDGEGLSRLRVGGTTRRGSPGSQRSPRRFPP